MENEIKVSFALEILSLAGWTRMTPWETMNYIEEASFFYSLVMPDIKQRTIKKVETVSVVGET